MNTILKNIELGTVLNMENEIAYADGQVSSKTLFQSDALSLTLFAFAKGEGLTPHATPGDALVTVLDGTVEIMIGDDLHILHKGDSIAMPNSVTHSLTAVEAFKMLLTVIF